VKIREMRASVHSSMRRGNRVRRSALNGGSDGTRSRHSSFRLADLPLMAPQVVCQFGWLQGIAKHLTGSDF
jgi:hypothetical protein